MAKIRHMCMDMRGFLRHTKYPSGFRGLFKDNDGKQMSPEMAREALFDALAKGWRLLPCGDCEGFDYQTGCPGHKQKETTDAD